ncbi:MAG: ATP-binding protein [Vicinamibacterales bacterium]|nr:ATP-binding protein [Vicinamibacterales bacterium]
MRRFLRREYTADYVALAYGLAYYVWLSLRTPGTDVTVLIGEYSFYPLGLAVGWMYLRNARLQELDGRTRLAWAILGTGALALWVIGNTWPRLIHYFGAAAFPGWVGVMEVVQHALVILAIMAFPGRTLNARDRTRFLADAVLIVVAGFVLASHYGIRAASAISPASPPAVTLAQSVLDWAVFVVAAGGVLHKRDPITRVALLWILAANTLYLSANYLLSSMPVYRLGDHVDGIWFAAWGCRWIAARFAWHRYRQTRAANVCRVESPVTDLRSGVFAYVLVAATFAVLVGRVASGNRENLELFAISATTMAVMLLVRQIAELRGNRRLFDAQIAQEARFRSLVQHASDVVMIVDDAGCVSYVSPSAIRLFGDGVITEGSRLADIIGESDSRILTARSAARHQSVRRRPCRMRTSAGQWREVEVVATDMRHDPAVRGTVINCRDVTERNTLEQQLQHARNLDAVGHLAGGLAHDFNNVLTAIRGYAELLREDLPQTSHAGADLAHIEQAVDRAAAVTRKLLSFSRKQDVQRVSLDLNAVLVGLDPLLRQMLTDRIEVRTDYAADLWPVRADQGQMEQVVINLVTNARDAMPQGGVLQIGTANRSITTLASETGGPPPGAYVTLIVRDQGVGIPESVRDRIFEPFFSTKPRDRGIGLGLAIVQGIVAQSHGHIAVQSTEGRGTDFTVSLPRAAAGVPRLAAGERP